MMLPHSFQPLNHTKELGRERLVAPVLPGRLKQTTTSVVSPSTNHNIFTSIKCETIFLCAIILRATGKIMVLVATPYNGFGEERGASKWKGLGVDSRILMISRNCCVFILFPGIPMSSIL